MKSITYEEFLEFGPCYLGDPKKKALMDSIAQRQDRWTALDILELKEIPDVHKLWAVLHEELIDDEELHKFACLCAERALNRVENPDPRSVAAIAAKRAWLRGEITNKELRVVRDAALDGDRNVLLESAAAAARTAAWAAALEDATAAAMDSAQAAAWVAERAAAKPAAWASERAAAEPAAWASERAWQVEELKKMLMEVEA